MKSFTKQSKLERQSIRCDWCGERCAITLTFKPYTTTTTTATGVDKTQRRRCAKPFASNRTIQRRFRMGQQRDSRVRRAARDDDRPVRRRRRRALCDEQFSIDNGCVGRSGNSNLGFYFATFVLFF
jgi:hypothetical protein